MMKTSLLLITTSLFFCTGMEERAKIDYRILEKEVRLSSKNSNFEISIELENSTDHNFILYRFHTVYSPFLSDSLLCVEREGAGNAIFITDSLGKRMPDEITIEMHGEDYPQRKVMDDSWTHVLKKVRSEYSDGKETIKAGQKRIVRLKFEMKNDPAFRNLKPGEYLTYLMYYAGDDLTRAVDGSPLRVGLIEETTIKADEKRYAAKVFKGWIRTNQIKLIVE